MLIDIVALAACSRRHNEGCCNRDDAYEKALLTHDNESQSVSLIRPKANSVPNSTRCLREYGSHSKRLAALSSSPMNADGAPQKTCSERNKARKGQALQTYYGRTKPTMLSMNYVDLIDRLRPDRLNDEGCRRSSFVV